MTRFIRSLGKGWGLLLVFIIILVTVGYIFQRAHDKAAAEAAAREVQHPTGHIKDTGGVDPGQAQKDTVLSSHNLYAISGTPEIKQPVQQSAVQQQAMPTLVSFYTAQVSATPTPEPIRPRPQLIWLPPNVLVPCQLIITVESSHINTPVFARVCADIYEINNGVSHLIIPEGSTVSAFAQSGSVEREHGTGRIEVAGTWNLVWPPPDNRQLRFTGIALNCDARPDTLQFGIENGSAGLSGEVIETDPYFAFKQVVGLLATAGTQAVTAAAGSALQASHGTSVVGLPDTTPALQTFLNGALNGQTGDGRFVRVVAGTRFWIFPTDTIQPTHRSEVLNSQMSAPEVPNETVREPGQPTPTPGLQSPVITYDNQK